MRQATYPCGEVRFHEMSLPTRPTFEGSLRVCNATRTETVLGQRLESTGRRTNATKGAPAESKLVLYSDRTTEIGIWEVTPGSFPARKDGVCELMQFVAGAGTITDASGVTQIGPGAVMFTPDGWVGTWDVYETVRKTYVVHQTKSALRRALRVFARKVVERLRRRPNGVDAQT